MGPPDPRPPDPAPQPLPAVKQSSPTALTFFRPTANPKNVAISDLRRFDTAVGSEFGVCMPGATVTGQAGKDIGTVVYVVTVVRNRVSDRRRALPADGCDKEKYEPL
jgi:hypothetical protein